MTDRQDNASSRKSCLQSCNSAYFRACNSTHSLTHHQITGQGLQFSTTFHIPPLTGDGRSPSHAVHTSACNSTHNLTHHQITDQGLQFNTRPAIQHTISLITADNRSGPAIQHISLTTTDNRQQISITRQCILWGLQFNTYCPTAPWLICPA